MAVLSDPDRVTVWKSYMSDLSRVLEALDLTKAQLRAAVNAVDSWVDDNASSLNQAIPQPARANMTATQKARLLVAVVERRFRVG